MKKFIYILFAALLISCNSDPRKNLPATGNFGTKVTENDAITVNDVLVKLNTENEFNATITGLISEYCKGEGCWLTLENQGGEPLFVEVENKAFVLPHNITGKVAVVTGKVSKTTNDAGKSEPMITASGILIK
jgi:hypothetical protein